MLCWFDIYKHNYLHLAYGILTIDECLCDKIFQITQFLPNSVSNYWSIHLHGVEWILFCGVLHIIVKLLIFDPTGWG